MSIICPTFKTIQSKTLMIVLWNQNYTIIGKKKDGTQNRWNKKDNHGNELAILPTICWRIFYYTMCPCCRNPSQKDCADSLVIGFSHLLCGLGKIRNSEVDNKKQSISDCNCVYHSRQENRDLWRTTNDFMLGMLCTPKEYTEFQNPEISQYSTQVIKIVIILHSY